MEEPQNEPLQSKSTYQPVIFEDDKSSQEDLTEELYLEVKDILSGSWKDDFGEIDGSRDVSWGSVPFSNQSYFIIDFQDGNKTIIKGGSEGGKEGFDRFVAEVLSIKKEDSSLYRFTYRDTIDAMNPRRKHDIVLLYNSENDTLSIVEYYGKIIENPRILTRISEPISS